VLAPAPGYSQAELAELAGVSINVVRKLEQDNGLEDKPRGVRLETLYELARALGVQRPPSSSRRAVPSQPTRIRRSGRCCRSG
jgi:transcriptional regulator with XRE-family HTH domain